jgi:hypothetical protein
MFESISNDENTLHFRNQCIPNDKNTSHHNFNNQSIIGRNTLSDKCLLPIKNDFWSELESKEILHNSVNCISIISNENPTEDDFVTRIKRELQLLTPNDEDKRTLVNYSMTTNVENQFKLEDVHEIINDDLELKAKFNSLVTNGILKLDKYASATLKPIQFSHFDAIELNDIKDYFNLDEDFAYIILNNLKENDILQEEQINMTRFNHTQWNDLVKCHLGTTSLNPEALTETKLLHKYANKLQTIKDHPRMLNITKDLLKVQLTIDDDDLTTLYGHLQESEIIESKIYPIWRLVSTLNCLSLPSCIASQIDEFLEDRFTYKQAFDKLCHSLENNEESPCPTPHEIFLPENSFDNLSIGLVNSGLAMPSRLYKSSSSDDFGVDYKDFEKTVIDEIKSVINFNRCKLYDIVHSHFELINLKDYIIDKGEEMNDDMRGIFHNGFRVVVAQRKKQIPNPIYSVFRYFWRKICSAAKGVSFFSYSIAQYCHRLTNKIISQGSNVLEKYINQAGLFVEQIKENLLKIKVLKTMVNVYKVAKEGYQIYKIGFLRWGGNKIINLLNTLYTKFKTTINENEYLNKAINAAIYAFEKMKSYCTARFESNEYYNECNIAARRIANETGDLIDEHTILRTFHQNNQKQEEIIKRDNLEEKVKIFLLNFIL